MYLATKDAVQFNMNPDAVLHWFRTGWLFLSLVLFK